MTTLTELGQVLQELLTRSADEVGRRSGFIRRQRKLTGSSSAQALVFGWMSNPAATMSELAQAAATGGAVISKQGLDKRFSEASARFMGDLLRVAVGQMITGEALCRGVFEQFSEAHVVDSTSVSLPEVLHEMWAGCNAQGTGSAALKISVDWELIKGRIVGLHLQAAKAHDQISPVARQPLAKRALCRRDLGYFNLAQFSQMANDGAFFLSRLKVSCKLYTPDGQPFDWASYVLTCPDDQVDCDVLVGAERLPCRFVAWRVAPEVADWRGKQLHQAALDIGRPVSPTRLQTAAWSVYITNVPRAHLSVAHIQVLAKVRWPIELLFKLWKSDGLLDEWRTADPWRALTECFAKLLALLIQHWCIVLGTWHLPNRSLHQAIQVLRKQAFHLAAVLADFDRLLHALSIIQAALATCKLSSLRKRPHTFQRILRGSLA